MVCDRILRNKKSNISNTKRKKALRRKLYEYFLSNPCVDCKEKDPIVLQFDHIKGIKVREVSNMVSNGCSWNKILEEIDKCEVVCANCHFRRTAKEWGWYKW